MSEASSSSEPGPARISPGEKLLGACILLAGRGGGDPGKAIEIVEKLAAFFQNDPATLLRWAHEHVVVEMNWVEGARYITRHMPGEFRAARAEAKLFKLLNDPRASRFREKGLPCVVHNDELDLDIYITRRPADWKQRGFTSFELEALMQFSDFISLQGQKAKNSAPSAKKGAPSAKRRIRSTRKS